MLERVDLDHVRKTKWYRQGGAVVPFYVYFPFRGASFLWHGKNNLIIQQTGIMHRGYFNNQAELKVALSDIKKQIKDQRYINKLIKDWELEGGKIDVLNKKIDWENLAILSTDNLIRISKQVFNSCLDWWKIGVHIESFDPWTEKIINDLLVKNKLKINQDDLSALMNPEELSLYIEEELDLFKIALSPAEKHLTLLKKHQKKYYWIKSDWAYPITLDVKYFQKRLNKFLIKDKKTLRHKIKETILRNAANKRKIKKIMRSYKINKELGDVFYFFRRMGYWRDIRKKEAMIMNGYYAQFLNEFSRRTGVSYEHLIFSLPPELFESKLNLSKQYKDELSKRSVKSIYFCDRSNNDIVLTGKEYDIFSNILEENFNSDFKELKGAVANRGKVTGRVVVVNTQIDFHKMKEGYILVAPMTRPDYLPLMRKAKAIITDEGGVTCHAAIVSRELNIPCIIGTQVATEMLKDGDVVEVDAFSGIIKIIE